MRQTVNNWEAWKRSDIKRKSRLSMHGSYWRMVIVCLLLSVFAGAPGLSTVVGGAQELQSVNFSLASNTQIVNSIVWDIFGEESNLWQEAGSLSNATQGVLAGVFNNVTSSGNLLFGTLNAVNQLFFRDRISAGIIILAGMLVMLAYRIFISNPLRVGEKRFFIECRSYPETKVNRVLYLFKIRKITRTAKILFLRDLFLILWGFTIVGGVYKWYSYRMISFILAENPGISRKRAFRLSESMMRGNRWKAFKLDVSFLGWSLLSTLSFGVFGILFLYPYKNAVDAELYMHLRRSLAARHPGARRYFNDLYLGGQSGDNPCKEYPVELYPIPEHPSRGWLSADYHRKYSLTSLVLMFFSFAMVGWVWEVFVDLVNKGHFVNRGTLFGPWLPIYGVGGVMMVVLLKRFADKPLLTFSLAVVLCGVMEYVTSWALETFKGQRWWDYSGYFMNINGRVCLEGLIVFGLGGALGIYLLAPMLDELFKKMPKKLKWGLCIGLSALFLADLVYSGFHPNTAAVV